MPLLGSLGAASARGFGSLTNFGYFIRNSVRLRSSASAYFNRTPASAGNRKTWTWSGWVKRGALGSHQSIFNALSSINVVANLRFTPSDEIELYFYNGGFVYILITTQVFRDPSSWYHLVCSINTTQATSTNRIKLYVNGSQVTAFSTEIYPTQNADGLINAVIPHYLGVDANNGLQTFLDGYLTEVNFIDGQALTPSSFGSYNASTGVWQPIKYAGTYGTNGFYLNFSDNSAATAAAIGKDYSGNGNNWTPNNISVTAGVTYDSMLDTPTPYADGGNGRGNYAVVNPLFRNASMISDGNLYFNKSTIGWATGQSTMSLPASKTYFEATAVLVGGANSGVFIGVATSSAAQDTYQVANQWSFGGTGGALKLYNQTTLVTPSGSSAAGDIFQVAYDGATGNLWFGKNNTWYDSAGGTTGSPSTGANPTMTLTAGTEVFPCAICYANALNFTFGQRPFTYTPPTGFVALNTRNLPDSTIKNGATVMAATTYTATPGTGATISNAVNGVSFRPDLLWVKNRNNVEQHYWQDSVRGFSSSNNVTKMLSSNSTAAEYSLTDITCTTTSSGFTVVDSTPGSGEFWFTNRTYVAWQWKAGDTAVTNTNGSITSQVSANPTAGFSIVTYTGTGANATVGHGLSVAPSMVIVKARNLPNGVARPWVIWHKAFSATEVIIFDTSAKVTGATTYWNSTTPTSSVFSLGTENNVNNATGTVGTYVAYCFSEVAGYSAFGSYTGNGSSDGPFVYCGFRPRWILIRSISAARDWLLYDTARAPFNVLTEGPLQPNSTNTAYSGSYLQLDILSNGFKPRDPITNLNASGETMIFAAFAENPFKNSLAR
jgi:hypothetical protein